MTSTETKPDSLERAIQLVGGDLVSAVRSVLDNLPVRGGPQAFARELGLDKVIMSRVLKAVRAQDGIAAVHAMPGPEPLRRFVRAAAKRGVADEAVAKAGEAIDVFDRLIRERLGDRSHLDAVVSAWVPEARREFEIRRKQAAFKAMSQIKGVLAEAVMATVVVSPSDDGESLDIAWINGLFGLRRVRPGSVARLTTRRIDGPGAARSPRGLAGQPIDDPASLLVREFSSDPAPEIRVHRAGDVVHYVLGGSGYGQDSATDIVFAEVNRRELPRLQPHGSSRLSYFFAEATPCAEVLQFDVVVHRDLYVGQEPSLRIYDTAFDGICNPNDPSKDLNRADMLESVESLGPGLERVRSMDIPRYAELLKSALSAMGQRAEEFRAFRCRIDYPVYASQVTQCFKAMTRAAEE